MAKADSAQVLAALAPFASLNQGWHRTNRWLWWPMYVDALIDLGFLDPARAAVEEMACEVDEGFRVLAVPHLHLCGRLAEASGDLTAARCAYQRAISAPSALAHPDRRAMAAAAIRRIGLAAAIPSQRTGEPPLHRLTTREQSIAGLIADGLSNREISSCLGIAEKTIEAHLTRVYRKLAVKSRREVAAVLAPRLRLGCARSGRLS